MPPETVRSPLESMPSPPASIVRLPPEIVMEAEESVSNVFCPALPLMLEPSAPPAALSPSSEATSEIVPPKMSIAVPSSPS